MRSQSKQEKMIRQKNVCFLHRTKILTENRKSATDAMREDLKGICDFEVRLPQTKAPRNRREEQLRMAQNEGAEIA